MDESIDDSNNDNRLAELVDALLAELDAGRPIDAEDFAKRFQMDRAEVEGCLEGLRAVHALGDEAADLAFDFDGDEEEPGPRPMPSGYEFIEEIGRGGMGVVFRARQASLDREVAMKIIRPGEQSFGRAIARFKKEARALARLRHPNIVAIHEVGEVEGQVYFTMDLIEGRSLDRVLREDAMTPARAVKIMVQVAAAVAYVHERGLIHRDLKPHNILLDDEDHAFVTDFGLVRQIDLQHTELTHTGQVLGTPAYMSPEQARGDADIGEATDVWAMGAVLYECLCGSPPFPGTSPVAILHAVIHEDPPQPRRSQAQIPPDLESIVLQCLARDPARRYAGARALQEDLERFKEGKPVEARRPSLGDRLWRILRRNAATLIPALTVAGLLIAAFLVFVAPRLGRDPQTARMLGDQLWQQGQGAAAVEPYSLAFATSPEDLELFDRLTTARIIRARELRTQGLHREAIAVLLDAARDSKTAEASLLSRIEAGEPRPAFAPRRLEIAIEALVTRVMSQEKVFATDALRSLRRAAAEDSQWPTSAPQDLESPFMFAIGRAAEDLTSKDALSLFRACVLRDDTPPPGLDARSHACMVTAIIGLRSSLDPYTPWDQVGPIIPPGTGRALVDIIDAPELPEWHRKSAALALAFIVDFHESETLPRLEDWDEQSLITLRDDWRRMARAPLRERENLRVERAFNSPLAPSLYRRWLSRHYPSLKSNLDSPEGIDELRAWWQREREKAPGEALIQALPLDLKPNRDADDNANHDDGQAAPETTRSNGKLSAARKLILEDRDHRGHASRLLAMLRPFDAGRPGRHGDSASWRRLLDIQNALDPEGRALQVAVFQTENGRIAAQPRLELTRRVQQIRQGHGRFLDIQNALPWTSRPSPIPLTSFTFPALSRSTRNQDTERRFFTVTVATKNLSPKTRIATNVRLLHEEANGSHRYLTGKDIYAYADRFTEHRGLDGPRLLLDDSRGDTHLPLRENELVLGRFISADAPSSNWQLGDWRRALTAELERRAAEVSAIPEKQRRRFLIHQANHDQQFARMASRIGLPPETTALETLRGAYTVLRPTSSAEMFEPALLMSGNADAIRRVEQKGLPALWDSYSEPRLSRMWMRILMDGMNTEARAFAATRLAKIDLPREQRRVLLAARLNAAIDHALIDRALGIEGSSIGLGLAIFAAFPAETALFAGGYGLLMLSILFAIIPRRRRFAPGLFILTGFLFNCVQVVWGEMDLLPDALGWGLAAMGSAAIGHRGLVRTRLHWLAPASFTFACLLELVVSEENEVLSALLHLSETAGLAGLMVLAFSSTVPQRDGRSLFGPVPFRLFFMLAAVSFILALAVRSLRFSPLQALTSAELLFFAGLFPLAIIAVRRPSPSKPPLVPPLITYLIAIPMVIQLWRTALRLYLDAESSLLTPTRSEGIAIILLCGPFFAILSLLILVPLRRREREARWAAEEAEDEDTGEDFHRSEP